MSNPISQPTGKVSTAKFRQKLKGDLDNIILKALRKEPGRRYASVEQFAEDIRKHLHKGPLDWVFANNAGRPRGQQNILQRQLRPSTIRVGIGKIGWHTFRHSYSTMLRAAGADIKVQQELLRHSTHSEHDEHLHPGSFGAEARYEQHGGRHSVQ